jgi:hypothetical protein
MRKGEFHIADLQEIPDPEFRIPHSAFSLNPKLLTAKDTQR